MTETKVEIIMFCPDCLARMRNGSNPNLYEHSVPSDTCPVDSVELNGNREIGKILYNDGNEKYVIKP